MSRITRRFGRNSKVSMALAGAGSIAVVHALAAQSAGIRVTAVASKGGTNARHLAGQLDARRVSPDALPAGADVLVVATPPWTHEEFLEQGLAAGSAVLVEKPLTTSLASADRMVRAAGRPGAPPTMVGENLLFSPQWLAAMTHRTQTGGLTHLSARVVQPPPTWGHFLAPLEAGGVLFDLGPHPIALVLELAGEDPVGVAARLSSSRDDGADDDASVKIRFRSGLVATLDVSWTAPSTEWSIQAASPDAVVRLELTPEPLVEVNGEPVVVNPVHDVVDPRLESMGYVDQLLAIASLASNAVDRTTDDEDLTDGYTRAATGQSIEDARDVLEVICAAYASAGVGGTEVPLPFTGDRSLTPMELWRSGQPA